jgi:pimeloyl-ACP methyl ester carboxylesterase
MCPLDLESGVPEAKLEAPMRTHRIAGGAGLKLHVRDFGAPEAPPILLLHGWSQHHLCWFKQFESSLAEEFRLVAPDLRGHGQSEAPTDAESYTTGALWADDVAAVISALQLASPILVGSSYGGFVIGDYLRSYGDTAIGGVNLVAGAVGIGPSWFGSTIGPDFIKYAPPAASEDQEVAMRAIHGLLHCFIVNPLPADELELAMGWMMLTPSYVRGHLISREDDFRPEYAQLRKPLLVSFGTSDTVVLPAMAETIRNTCPGCRLSEFGGTGHFPFLEEPARFNRELAEFTRTSAAGHRPLEMAIQPNPTPVG